MKIAIAQLNYTIGDIDGNTSKIIDAIQRAKAQRADLVIFAEQAVSGTPAFDLLRKTTFLELCEDALVEIASCCDGIAAIVGLPILTSSGTISAAALIQDRKVLRYVGKKYITARREMGFLVPSKGYEYATIKGHKCAIIVGDDLSREHDFDKSVETIISINARRYGKGTMIYRYEMLRNRLRRRQEPGHREPGRGIDRDRLRRNVGSAQQTGRTGADAEELRGGLRHFRYPGQGCAC